MRHRARIWSTTARLLAAGRRRPTGDAVQDALESALREFAGIKLPTICAGRTDAGVHATLPGRPLRHRLSSARCSAGSAASTPFCRAAWRCAGRGPCRMPFTPAMARSRVATTTGCSTIRCVAAGGAARWLGLPPARRGAHAHAPRRISSALTISRVPRGRVSGGLAGAYLQPARDRASRGAAAGPRSPRMRFCTTWCATSSGRSWRSACRVRRPTGSGEVLAARDRRRAAPTFAAGGLYLSGVQYDVSFGLPEPVDAMPCTDDRTRIKICGLDAAR